MELEQEKVKLAGRMPTEVPRSVLGDITVAPGGTAFVRSKQSISKAIYRERQTINGFPHKPKVFEDILRILPQLKVTSDGQPYLVLNDTVDDAKRLLIFMSQHGREVLSGCTSWYVDASCTLFTQIVFGPDCSGQGFSVSLRTATEQRKGDIPAPGQLPQEGDGPAA
jgi:hypothetical protein